MRAPSSRLSFRSRFMLITAPRRRPEEMDTELLVYEGKTYFGIMLESHTDIPAGEYRIQGTFSFQACDDTSCLPPKKIEFEINFRLVAPSQATNLLNKEIFAQIKFEKEQNLP